MHALIENLVKLQAIKLDHARLAQEVRLLPAEIAQAEATLAAAERRAAEASSALNREDSLRTRLEREIDAHRRKAARFRVQLDSVNTPAQAEAIEHEIQFASTEAEGLENEEYASLERTESYEGALAEARAQVEVQAASLETVRSRVAARQLELAAQIAALEAEQESVREVIEPDWLDRFDRLAASRGTGIARAENQQCTGCRMGVRPQTWNELREGKLLACDSCNRLLYWDPAMAPAPTAAQPTPVPGAGRAIRRPHQAGG